MPSRACSIWWATWRMTIASGTAKGCTSRMSPTPFSWVARLGGERVVDDQEVARAGRSLHRAELRLLLAHPLERRGDLLVVDGLGRVLDLDALVLAERDRRLHLDDGDEAERRTLLQLDVLQVGLVHRVEVRFREGLPVDVGDEVLGDLAPDVVGEVQLDERARYVALPDAREARLLLDAPVSACPLPLADVGRGLHRPAPLATLDRLDFDPHRRSTLIHAPRWCERGESNPQGLAPTGS